MRYRKKPVEVEAVPCREAIQAFKKDWAALPDWLAAAYERGGVVVTDGGIHLPTTEGTMFALPDDWIICGTRGEIYPCKPNVFEDVYEPVAHRW